MATDYYQMGKDLGSAYGDGVEVRRQRDRQIETDARAKKQFDNQQVVFDQQQTVYGQQQKQYIDTTDALGGGGPAGLPAPAGPNGSRDAPPQTGGLADPAGPIGSRGAPQAAGLPAEAPAKFDAHMAVLEQALKLARATRDVAGVNKANASIAQHKINLEDGAAVTGLMSAPAERLQELYGHINTHSKKLTAIADVDAKGKPTGYTKLLMVAPDGTASELLVSKAQLGKVLIGQRKVDRGDMTGIDDMEAVSSKLAAAVASEMGMVRDTTTTNNKVKHDVVTGNAATITAGAAATRAASDGKLVTARIKEIDADRASVTEAKLLQRDFNNLTPEEQNGPKGLALQKQYNMLSAKPGTQLQTAGPRGQGGARQGVDAGWLKAEEKLMAAGTELPMIQQQKDGFYARAGFAPASVMSEMATGVRANGEKMGATDVAKFRQLFPNTPLDASQLAWLPKPAAPGAPTKAGGLPGPAKPAQPRAAGLPSSAELYQAGGGAQREASGEAAYAASEQARAARSAVEARAGGDPELRDLMLRARETGDPALHGQIEQLRKNRYGL